MMKEAPPLSLSLSLFLVSCDLILQSHLALLEFPNVAVCPPFLHVAPSSLYGFTVLFICTFRCTVASI